MESAGSAVVGAFSINAFKGCLNKIKEKDGIRHGLIRWTIGLPG